MAMSPLACGSSSLWWRRLVLLSGFFLSFLVVLASSSLVDHDGPLLRVRRDVRVLLIGLQPGGGGGGGDDDFDDNNAHSRGHLGVSLSAQQLASALLEVMPSRRPAMAPACTPMDVAVTLKYDVRHATAPDALTKVETAIKSAMRNAADTASSSSSSSSSPRFDVEAKGAVEETILQIVKEEGRLRNAPNEDPEADDAPATVVIINPSKLKMHPTESNAVAARAGSSTAAQLADAGLLGERPHDVVAKHDGGYRYAYRYDGSVGRSQAFLSRHRIVVIDLSAGPVAVGRAGRFGAAASRASPRLAELLARQGAAVAAGGKPDEARQWRDGSVVARTAAAIAAAVRAVVVPDMRSDFVPPPPQVPGAETPSIVAPVVVLRNHAHTQPFVASSLQDAKGNEWNLWAKSTTSGSGDGGGDGQSLNLAVLEGVLRRLSVAFFGRDAAYVTAPGSVHQLHNHAGFSSALHRSFRGDSDERDASRFRRHIDGQHLLEEIHNIGDKLAAALLDLADESSVEDVETMTGSEDAPPVPKRRAPLRPKGRLQLRAKGAAASAGRSRSADAHVYPLFVYQLMDHELPGQSLVDGREMQAVDSGVGVVVSHVGPEVEVPIPGIHVDGSPAFLEPMLPTGAAAAALLASVGGLIPPHESCSETPFPGGTEHDIHLALSLSAAAPMAVHHSADEGTTAASFVAHGRAMEEDWTFAVGAHPLGPLSNSTSEISQLLVDAARQHALLITLHHAARLVASVKADIAHGVAESRNASVADASSHSSLAEAEASLAAAVENASGHGMHDVSALSRAERAYQRALALRASTDARVEADDEALRCCRASARTGSGGGGSSGSGARAFVLRHGARAALGWAALGLTSFSLLFVASGGAGEAAAAISKRIARRKRMEVIGVQWKPGLL